MLLDVYLLVSFCTAISIMLIASRLRESHGMCSITVLRLAVLAAITWPLLAFATIQVSGLLVLAKCFGVVRRPRTTGALPPADVALAVGSATSTVK